MKSKDDRPDAATTEGAAPTQTEQGDPSKGTDTNYCACKDPLPHVNVTPHGAYRCIVCKRKRVDADGRTIIWPPPNGVVWDIYGIPYNEKGDATPDFDRGPLMQPCAPSHPLATIEPTPLRTTPSPVGTWTHAKRTMGPVAALSVGARVAPKSTPPGVCACKDPLPYAIISSDGVYACALCLHDRTDENGQTYVERPADGCRWHKSGVMYPAGPDDLPDLTQPPRARMAPNKPRAHLQPPTFPGAPEVYRGPVPIATCKCEPRAQRIDRQTGHCIRCALPVDGAGLPLGPVAPMATAPKGGIPSPRERANAVLLSIAEDPRVDAETRLRAAMALKGGR